MTLRCLLEEVLEEEDELGEPLDGLHHQSEEVEAVMGTDLLHLQCKDFLLKIETELQIFKTINLVKNSCVLTEILNMKVMENRKYVQTSHKTFQL